MCVLVWNFRCAMMIWIGCFLTILSRPSPLSPTYYGFMAFSKWEFTPTIINNFDVCCINWTNLFWIFNSDKKIVSSIQERPLLMIPEIMMQLLIVIIVGFLTLLVWITSQRHPKTKVSAIFLSAYLITGKPFKTKNTFFFLFRYLIFGNIFSDSILLLGHSIFSVQINEGSGCWKEWATE